MNDNITGESLRDGLRTLVDYCKVLEEHEPAPPTLDELYTSVEHIILFMENVRDQIGRYLRAAQESKGANEH